MRNRKVLREGGRRGTTIQGDRGGDIKRPERRTKKNTPQNMTLLPRGKGREDLSLGVGKEERDARKEISNEWGRGEPPTKEGGNLRGGRDSSSLKEGGKVETEEGSKA